MRPLSDDTKAYLLINLSTFLWSTNIVLGRALRNSVSPLVLAAARFSVGGLLFAALLTRRDQGEQRPGSDLKLLTGMAFTGVFAFPSVLYLGLRYTTALNAALVNAVAPLLTALLAHYTLGESFGRGRAFGIFLSLSGVAFVVTEGSWQVIQNLQFNPGDALVVVAALLWSAYSVLGRVATLERSALSATAFSVFFALPLLYPAALWEGSRQMLNLSPIVLLAIVYIGIFPTVIAFSSWNESVKRLGPSRAMAFYNTLPLFGTLLSVLLLGEQLKLSHVIGGGLIILGGYLGSRTGRGELTGKKA